MRFRTDTYTTADYGDMIADRQRTGAYFEALRRAVRPGAVVLDIGTGTGFFALLACKFGARRVYAIEVGDSLPLAREIAAANGYADRIEFIANHSTQVSLPDRADVIVSDLRGALPLFRQHLTSIIDARRRLLAPGGTLIPLRDTLWGAVIEDSELPTKLHAPSSENCYGLDLRAGRRISTSMSRKVNLKSEQLLVAPEACITLDYTILESADVRGHFDWQVARPGVALGFCLWFEAELAEGMGFSCRPESPDSIYSQVLFPWPEPVALAAGDLVSVVWHANLVGEEYIWRWETTARSPDGGGPLKAHFLQSSFEALPLSAESFRKRDSAYRPALDEEGQVDLFILSRMTGHATEEEIAREAVVQFPARFVRWEDALARVGDLAQKYSP